MNALPPRATKRCANCRREFPLIFYRKGWSSSSADDENRRKICKGCEQTGRDHKKQENPYLSKAYSAIRDHAHGWGITVAKLRGEFDWDPELIAHQMERAYGNGCPVCHRLFVSMGHGLGDLTVDIRDRSKPPVWGHNTWLICNTCNQEKGTLCPEDFADLCLAWKRWETEPWPEDPQMGLFDQRRLAWEEFKSAPFPGSATLPDQGYLGF